MKLTNRQVIDVLNGITAVSNVDFPLDVSWILSKNQDLLEAAYKPYSIEEDKIRNKINAPKELEQKIGNLQDLESTFETEALEMINTETLLGSGVRLTVAQIQGVKQMLE